MKYFLILVILIGFVGTVFALDDEILHPKMIALEEHYEIQIIGLEDEYVIGEEYSFHFVISGYGHSCASYQVSYPDENGNIMFLGTEPLCAPETSMHEFKINSSDRKGTLGNIGIKKPGTFTVTVTFEKPNKYFPTKISKEFLVVESSTKLPSSEDYEFESLSGARCDGEPSVCYGIFPNGTKIQIQCDYVRHGCGPVSFDDYKIFYSSPLKQFQSGINIEDIMCQNNKFLILKYDDSPACVKPVTKQHLIDRGWAKTKSLDEIQGNPDLIKQNIIRIEDGFIALYPENMCASISLELLSEQDIQRYKNDDKGLDDTNILQITSGDLQEIPNIRELIYAVHSIEFPYNKYSSAYLDGPTFVDYEFFLMNKSMKKYGDSQEDYFIKLDKDYDERFTNPAKQGFSNTFEAPVIVYKNNAYSIDGTVFWTSDEHEPMRMGVYPKETIGEDEKFITLTDEDMRLLPKIKEAIENIGTIKESISAYKGLPEDQWNEYRQWFEQKSQDRLNVDWFRVIQYNEQIYPVGFVIC